MTLSGEATHTRTIRQFIGSIDQSRGISSYSALSRSAREHHAMPVAKPSPAGILLDPSAEPSRFDLEKGAHVGNFLHDALETLDWDHLQREPCYEALAALMLRYGVKGCEDTAIIARYQAWLVEVLQTPFAGSTKLSDISTTDRLAEMEFFLPIKDTLSSDMLNPIVSAWLPEPLSFAPVSGHLKGFIDLSLRIDGRYYVADYKSNYLGPSYLDYRDDELTRAVVNSGYTLQYLIYVVALHRHLQRQLPDYDYERHFGGVYYLYLRGMHPKQGLSGVYHDRPSFNLVNQLDQLFAEGSLNG